MGRIFRPSYSVKRPDGSTERRRTSWYHVEWTDGRGRTRRKKAASSTELAREILRKAEEEVSAERWGLPTQKAREIRLDVLRGGFEGSERSRGRAGRGTSEGTARQDVERASDPGSRSRDRTSRQT